MGLLSRRGVVLNEAHEDPPETVGIPRNIFWDARYGLELRNISLQRHAINYAGDVHLAKHPSIIVTIANS